MAFVLRIKIWLIFGLKICWNLFFSKSSIFSETLFLIVAKGNKLKIVSRTNPAVERDLTLSLVR